LLYREAAALDERRWDDWLALFTADCEFWMPMWGSEAQLNDDPQRQLSHVYYTSRAGLEDRITRIRSRRSPASSPLPRTTHLIGAALECEGAGNWLELRTSWCCHVFYQVGSKDHAFHGSSHYVLARGEGGLQIARKKIQLMNDYIPTMLDIYCV
jgi:3-phenylpropionate/cinnamic acid dioxygenase small subunit